MIVAPPRPVPAVHVRGLTAEDAPLLQPWTIAPEQFLRVEDQLACAEVPGAVTLVGLAAKGRLVAVLQSVPAGCAGDGMRSVSLLVHPDRGGRCRSGAGQHGPRHREAAALRESGDRSGLRPRAGGVEPGNSVGRLPAGRVDEMR